MLKSMLKSILRSFIVICLIWVAYGFTIPSYEWYITDKVGVFSETQKTDLTNKTTEIEQTTSIEIAILVVSTVDDDINLAAVDVGNQWWVGKKGQDNGLMVLIAIDDRKWSIQVGYGLEGTLPDLVAKQIGENNFPPNFRNGDYYQGIMWMLNDALLYIKQDPTIVNTYSQTTTSNSSFDEKSAWFLFLLFFIVISAFGRRVTVPSIKDKKRKMKKYGRLIYAGTWIVLALLVALIIPFILALFASYLFLLIWVLTALYGRTGNTTWRGMRFWWWWSGFGWWGWGFGGFGGGSFWWWGWWWSR
jgi:uncharacterized protein